MDTALALRPLLCPSEVRDSFLLLKNFGETPLMVTGITLTLADQGITITSTIPSSIAPLIVPPDGVDTVRLRLATTAIGTKSATVTVVSAGRELHATITGRKDSLRLAPDATLISFDGALPPGAYPRDTTIMLRNTGTVPVTLIDADVVGADPTRVTLDRGALPPLP